MKPNTYETVRNSNGVVIVRYQNMNGMETDTLYIHSPIKSTLVIQYGIYRDPEEAMSDFERIAAQCITPEAQHALCLKLAGIAA